MRFLDAFLGWLRLYRRLRGGHWEFVYVRPPVSSDMWFRQPHTTEPRFGEGVIRCEDHPSTSAVPK